MIQTALQTFCVGVMEELSTQSEGLTRCEKASAYIVCAGTITGIAGAILSQVTYSSLTLSGLFLTPTIGCAIGFLFIRNRREMRERNQRAEEPEEPHRSTPASPEIQIQIHNDTLSSTRSHEQIEQMERHVSSLTEMNLKLYEENHLLKTREDALKRDFSILSNRIDLFEAQNRNLCSSLRLSGLITPEDRHLENPSNAPLEFDVPRLMQNLENAQTITSSLVWELNNQNEQLRTKIEELSAVVSQFEMLAKTKKKKKQTGEHANK